MERCNGITDKGLGALCQCHLLERLVLSYCVLVTDEGVNGIVKHCPALKTLSCVGCPSISGNMVQHLEIPTSYAFSGAYGSMMSWDGNVTIASTLDWSDLPV